jgi:hypothetical protein
MPLSATGKPSILNQPTPEFQGAANAIYGDRGPQRAAPDYRSRARPSHQHEPQSIADHVDEAISRVAGLGPKQKLALHNELVRLTQNIGFIRMIAQQTHGPYSEAAVQDEGRPL